MSYFHDLWSYNRITMISSVVHTPNNVLSYQEHLLHDVYACSKVSPHEYRILYSVHVSISTAPKKNLLQSLK